MVHNGIEYGDMQLCCEAYHLMKDALGMKHEEMSNVTYPFLLIYFTHALLVITCLVIESCFVTKITEIKPGHVIHESMQLLCTMYRCWVMKRRLNCQ